MPQPWYTPLEPLERRHDAHTVYRDFACLATCALSGGQREERSLETAKRYTSEELHTFARALGTLTEAMECEPYTDLLGERFLELEGRYSKQARGEFYTPQNICDMMAEMTLLPTLEEGQVLTVNDPACGSGRMVLGVAKALERRGISPLCIQATVQDLSRTAVDLAFINLTLWGIPTRAIWGDTLRCETRDVLENLFWHRARPYAGEGERMYRVAHQLERILSRVRVPEEEAAPVVPPVQPGLFG